MQIEWSGLIASHISHNPQALMLHNLDCFTSALSEIHPNVSRLRDELQPAGMQLRDKNTFTSTAGFMSIFSLGGLRVRLNTTKHLSRRSLLVEGIQ